MSRFCKGCFIVIYCFLIRTWHKSLRAALKIKKGRIFQSTTNKPFFYPIHHQFPPSSLSSLWLSLELSYERPLERNWPSSLPVSAGYRLIKPAPTPLWPGWPAITLGSGLACCKIFIDAPLGPWELCTNTLMHCQTHLHTSNSPTKTIKCWLQS